MNFKTFIYAFLKDRFNLEKNKEESLGGIDSISGNIYFRGTNLWVLIFAILIASIGLNVNSEAESKVPDTINLVYLKFRRQISEDDLHRLDAWLPQRMKGEKIKIVLDK